MATARENERLCETISELKGVINTASTALTSSTEASTDIFLMIAKTLAELAKRKEEPAVKDIYVHYDYEELKKLYDYWYGYYYYYGCYYEPTETIINININRSKT